MAAKNQVDEDDVLKRMLSTPPKKNEPTTPLGKRRRRNREAAKAGVPHLGGKPFKSGAEASSRNRRRIQTTLCQH